MTTQEIADKIAERIAAKAQPNADPAKVLASDLSEILIDMLMILSELNGTPLPPPTSGTGYTSTYQSTYTA